MFVSAAPSGGPSRFQRRPSIPQGGFDWCAHRAQRRKTVSISLLPLSDEDDDDESCENVDDDNEDEHDNDTTFSHERSCPLFNGEREKKQEERYSGDLKEVNDKRILRIQESGIHHCIRSSVNQDNARCACSSSCNDNNLNNNSNNNNNDNKYVASEVEHGNDNHKSYDKRRSRRKKKNPYETVIINVGGHLFETYRTTLRRLRTPIFQTKGNLEIYYRKSKGDYFFDRDPTAFGSILNFLRTGELHIPTNMCGPALQNELDFWGIEEADIARCCWTQYNTWKTQCRSLEKLEYDRKFSTTQHIHQSDEDMSCCARFKSLIWTFLQDPGSSKIAKVYAWVSIIFVFVSIFSFCAETHPTFKVKAKEVTQFATFYDHFSLESVDWPKLKLSNNTSGPLRHHLNSSETTEALNLSLDLGNRSTSNKHRVGKRSVALHEHILNCNARLFHNTESKKNNTEVADKDLPHPALLLMDLICLIFFTLEYLTRFFCSPSKLIFVRALQNIVDFLAFAPDYVELIFLVTDHHHTEGVAIMEMLFVLRILRLFRIFRLIRHVPGLWILLYTLRASFNELMLMCVFLLIGMVVFATLVHFVEPEGIFSNIPVGFWWSVVTMTTVGYGDMYPQSPAGFFIGSCCAVAGLLMIAFTVPIIVSNFVLYYTHVQYGLARREHELEKRREEDEVELFKRQGTMDIERVESITSVTAMEALHRRTSIVHNGHALTQFTKVSEIECPKVTSKATTSDSKVQIYSRDSLT